MCVSLPVLFVNCIVIPLVRVVERLGNAKKKVKLLCLTFNFGSFHKITISKLNIRRNTRVYDGDLCNVLFLDGSSAFESPEDGPRFCDKK